MSFCLHRRQRAAEGRAETEDLGLNLTTDQPVHVGPSEAGGASTSAAAASASGPKDSVCERLDQLRRSRSLRAAALLGGGLLGGEMRAGGTWGVMGDTRMEVIDAALRS
jgi:hypothetical protein